METILFLVFGILAVVAGIAVITFRNPIYSALALIMTFFSQAGLFILLGAHFVAVVQIIVYAGAIMVLFLFVIMLLNLGATNVTRPVAGVARVVAIILGILFAVEGVYIASKVYSSPAIANASQKHTTDAKQLTIGDLKDKYHLTDEQLDNNYVPKVVAGKKSVSELTPGEIEQLIQIAQKENLGKTYSIGVKLFTDFLLPFEITSLILLAALIGVIVLVKRENPKPVN
jgi:NADH-quinone oxidoreductase subunit J